MFDIVQQLLGIKSANADIADPGIAPCRACTTGPIGFDGHAAMRRSHSHVGPPTGAPHQCTTCGNLWYRLYKGRGIFVWLQPLADARPPRAVARG